MPIDLSRESRYWTMEWTWRPGLRPTGRIFAELGRAMLAMLKGSRGMAVCGPIELPTDDAEGKGRVVVIRWHQGAARRPINILSDLTRGNVPGFDADPRFHLVRPEDRKLPWRADAVLELAGDPSPKRPPRAKSPKKKRAKRRTVKKPPTDTAASADAPCEPNGEDASDD